MKRLTIPTAIITFFLIIPGCVKKKAEKEEKPVVKVEVPVEVPVHCYMVTKFKKNVSWSPDDSIWNRIEKEMELDAGVYVETGKRSLVLLEGSVGDMVIVGEQSKVRLTFDELIQYAKSGTGRVRGLGILKGKVTFDIKKVAGGFFVKTPSAMVKVKGTNFTVAYDTASKTTDVQVLEGEVVVEDTHTAEAVKHTIISGEKLEKIGKDKTPQKKNLTKDEIGKIFDKKAMEEIKEGTWPQVSFRSVEEEREIRARLSEEMRVKKVRETVKGRETVKEVPVGIPDTEKQQSRTVIDSVKTQYTEDKKEIKKDFEEHKKTVQKEVINEKISARRKLDIERDSLRSVLDAERSQRKSNSGDRFDELKRRRKNK